MNHREWLPERLRTLATSYESLDQDIEYLTEGVDKFAKWRWKTLYKVCTRLASSEKAMRWALHNVTNPKAQGSRNIGHAAHVLRLAHDEDVWAKASDLMNMIAPLMSRSAWVRGCDCHEAELLAGHDVQCRWKGRRQTSLGKRLGQLLCGRWQNEGSS